MFSSIKDFIKGNNTALIKVSLAYSNLGLNLMAQELFSLIDFNQEKLQFDDFLDLSSIFLLNDSKIGELFNDKIKNLIGKSISLNINEFKLNDSINSLFFLILTNKVEFSSEINLLLKNIFTEIKQIENIFTIDIEIISKINIAYLLFRSGEIQLSNIFSEKEKDDFNFVFAKFIKFEKNYYKEIKNPFKEKFVKAIKVFSNLNESIKFDYFELENNDLILKPDFYFNYFCPKKNIVNFFLRLKYFKKFNSNNKFL